MSIEVLSKTPVRHLSVFELAQVYAYYVGVNKTQDSAELNPEVWEIVRELESRNNLLRDYEIEYTDEKEYKRGYAEGYNTGYSDGLVDRKEEPKDIELHDCSGCKCKCKDDDQECEIN